MKLDQIRRRVGQMFIVGFEGKGVDEDLKKLIQQHFIGGVILFENNIESPKQIAELTNEIQSLSKTPLFVAVDQEGGRVARLKKPFTDFGEAARIAKTNSPKLAFEAFQAMARELRAVGINYNFAPVADLNTNPKNPVIGNRAFGSDPETVSKIISGVIRGLQRGGVIACAKHFPGHGDTSLDSHLDLPEVTHSVEYLKAREWIPFDRAIRSGVETIMTAHILNRNIDPDLPATLSKKTLQYLRTDLRFDRVIITDALEMKAIADRFSIEEATLKAVEAGVDMVLLCHSFGKEASAIETIVKKVATSEIPMKQIDLVSEHITKLRNKYLVPYHPANLSKIDDIVGCEEHQMLAEQLLQLAL